MTTKDKYYCLWHWNKKYIHDADAEFTPAAHALALEISRASKQGLFFQNEQAINELFEKLLQVI